MSPDTFTSDLILTPPDTVPSQVRFSPGDVAAIPIIWEGDVVVAGGGSAGSAAAVVAGRHGRRTLLVEDAGFFGGTAAAVLDTMYGFFPPGQEARVVGGIGWEIANHLLETEQAILRANTYGAGTGVTYEPEALKRRWDELILAAGVQPLLHTRVTGVIMEIDTVIGIVVHTRRGPFRVLAKRFVDASGDGQIAWAAGAALEVPTAERRVQPLTTTFRVGGVGTPPPTTELHRLMRESADSGDYRLPRREGSAHRTVLPGVFHTNLTRVAGVDPTNPWAYSASEIEGRAQTSEYARFLRDRVPGYEASYLLSTSTWIGMRETRRLLGEYVLTREDVLEARAFEDAIALCGAPIEDHDGGEGTIWKYVAADDNEPTGRTYGVPYRCLVPVGIEGLIVAGRCLSATHDAHASARSIAQCLSYGHAAGVAAALSLDTGCALRDLDTELLRGKLLDDGVIL